jgi:hypothetical protein
MCVRDHLTLLGTLGELMPGAFLRPIDPASVRDLYRSVLSRIDSWTLYALNAQPWGRHTPTS